MVSGKMFPFHQTNEPPRRLAQQPRSASARHQTAGCCAMLRQIPDGAAPRCTLVWLCFYSISSFEGKSTEKKTISPKQCVNTMKLLRYWLHPGGSKVVAYLVAFFGGHLQYSTKFPRSSLLDSFWSYHLVAGGSEPC